MGSCNQFRSVRVMVLMPITLRSYNLPEDLDETSRVVVRIVVGEIRLVLYSQFLYGRIILPAVDLLKERVFESGNFSN